VCKNLCSYCARSCSCVYGSFEKKYSPQLSERTTSPPSAPHGNLDPQLTISACPSGKMTDSMAVKGTPVVSATAVPSPPPGMLARTTTTKYPDGREVTLTEFVPAASVPASTAFASVSAPPPTRAPTVGIRSDLGYDPVSITCQYCNEQTPTRTVKDIGACTWISCIILFFFFFPLFWLPFVCADVSESYKLCFLY
ncbi:hypothetical protein ACHAWX_002436, partial [Stephanocyclus meneghinianus]